MDEPTLSVDPLEQKFFQARVQGPWDWEDPWSIHSLSSRNTSRPGPLGRLQRLIVTRSPLPIWQAYAAAGLTLCLLVGVGRVFWNAWDLMGAPAGNTSPSHSEAVADRGESEDTPLATIPGPTPTSVPPSPEPKVVAVEIDAATIQVATFRDRSNADRLVAKLRDKYGQARVRPLNDDLYQVTMGPFVQKGRALGIAEEIQAELQLTTLVVTTPIVQIGVAAQ